MIVDWSATKKRRSECFDLNISYIFNDDIMEATLLIHHYNYPTRKTFFNFGNYMKDELLELIIEQLKEDTDYKFGRATYHYLGAILPSTLEWFVFDNKKRTLSDNE
jgi:hypothetical protein